MEIDRSEVTDEFIAGNIGRANRTIVLLAFLYLSNISFQFVVNEWQVFQ
jgi:hypothetical protein